MSDSTDERFTVPSDNGEPYYTDEWYDKWDDDAWEERDEDDDDWDGMDDYYDDDCDEGMTLLDHMQYEKIPGWLIAIISFYLRVRDAWRLRNVEVPF